LPQARSPEHLKSLPLVVMSSEWQSGHLLDVLYSLFSSTSMPYSSAFSLNLLTNVVEAPEVVYYGVCFTVFAAFALIFFNLPRIIFEMLS